MPLIDILFYCCLAILLCDSVIGLIRFRRMDLPIRIFWVLVTLSFISEIIAVFVELIYKTKAPVYHFFSIPELFLTSLFFLYTIRIHPKTGNVLLLALACIALGLSNLYFFQSLWEYNTYMLMLECALIIGMALFALFRILLREDLIEISASPHFRIWIALLVLWTSTFFFWSFLNYLRQQQPEYYSMIATGQVIVNMAVYGFIGFTFYNIKGKLNEI